MTECAACLDSLDLPADDGFRWNGFPFVLCPSCAGLYRQQAVGGKPPHPWLGGRILDWLDHHDAGASQSMRASSPGRVH